MLHHISFGVRNLELSGAFYDAALGALGFRRVFDGDESIGYGLIDNQDMFLLNLETDPLPPGEGFHLAFSAPSRTAVDVFHATALIVGGHDNGQPGLRLEYGPNYYAAYLIDPDGHRIEAVINIPTLAFCSFR
ncbi:VOC family protein [Rheinheimera hassiensis]|uniref:VOC family protein n=1 Tax=Rheinheimera hassiensis TaxID=1193627 RepID=UPI001F0535BD|nr:VOC family protein [Rheinheimera hassiensis]